MPQQLTGLTTRQAAERVGLGDRSIRLAIKNGELKSQQIVLGASHVHYIQEADLRRYIKTREKAKKATGKRRGRRLK